MFSEDSSSLPFDPDEALAGLAQERQVMDLDEVEQAEKMFKENLPLAVLAVTTLARTAVNERIRLDASKYVVERNLGGLKDVDPTRGKGDPLLDLLGEVVRDSVESSTTGAP